MKHLSKGEHPVLKVAGCSLLAVAVVGVITELGAAPAPNETVHNPFAVFAEAQQSTLQLPRYVGATVINAERIDGSPDPVLAYSSPAAQQVTGRFFEGDHVEVSCTRPGVTEKVTDTSDTVRNHTSYLSNAWVEVRKSSAEGSPAWFVNTTNLQLVPGAYLTNCENVSG
ncbi:MAG TPA: hypothetical protein VKQ34_04755 [Candidatus Saccharimonadales bacterium]|nr:hypothetical protein [Candidatus Saccharimonadales bacterium]